MVKMSFKFSHILSVIVLAGVVQIHCISYPYGNYTPQHIEHVNYVLDQVLDELNKSMNLVLLSQPPGSNGEVTNSEINVFLTIPHLTGVADDLFGKLKTLIDAALEKAREAIQFAKDGVNEVAESAQSVAKQQMDDIAEELKNKLEHIKEKAQTSGINIDDCLKGNEDRLLDLPNKVSGELVHCVSDQVNKAMSYADDGLEKIQNVFDEVTNIKQEIENCGSGFKAFICLTKLGIVIAKDIFTLPSQIEADYTSAVSAITELKGHVMDCAANKIIEMKQESTDILATISDCATAKGVA